MKIVFENENWIVVDKPAQVLTVPSRFVGNDQRQVVGHQLQKMMGRQIFPVHRLDFEVSGVLLWALDAETHRRSQDWFEHKKIQKTYRALSRPQNFSHWPTQIKRSEDVITADDRQVLHWRCRLSKGKRRAFESERGLDSQTDARIVEVNSEGLLVWKLNPITGRSHQLRFEMSRHGFPIEGDLLYGGLLKAGADSAGTGPHPVQSTHTQGIALRAVELNLKFISPSERLGLPEVLVVEDRIGGFE